MRREQTLFSSPIALAHHYWKLILKNDDTAIDATCGTGKDSLYLAQLLSEGVLIALDIQEKAIRETSLLLKEKLQPSQLERIYLHQQSHTSFPPVPEKCEIKLIVYNLGYLPKSGQKQITTLTETTLESVQKALQLIALEGACSITCYPGHPEGKREEQALLHLFSTLDSTRWNLCYHRWINRPLSPSLFFIQKRF
jgi:hypothetical protein